MHQGLQVAIYGFSEIFRWIFQKQIQTINIPKMKVKVAKAIFLLEIYFPPNFFDMQVHNVVHIPEEVELVGLINFRWLYFLERCMKYLKSMVRQLAHPEGSVVEGYLAQKAMFYYSIYLKTLHPSATSIYKDVFDPKESSELVLPEKYQKRRLLDEE